MRRVSRARAEGEGNADSTPAPTEAVQPTESAEPTAPTETETPEVTEVPEPTPENPAATVEPTQGEPIAEPTDEGIMPANVMPVQANVAARDTNGDGFIRIFHLDCGRKYFSVSEINGIIDQLAENNYTHIQLAFGNDGLRFLLDDMSVTVNDKAYDSDSVKTAIKNGNSQLTNGSSGELSQSEMESIISYANGKGIKVIPLFNAPGHMYAVVNAMNTLEVNGKYIQVSNPNDSARTRNWAVDPTDANAVAFAEALLGKYVAYFAGKGSTMFNIGADESGINNENYSAYATMVNAMNSIVKRAGMTTLAYNDGIYNTSFASIYPSVSFDNDIVICYWTSGANSESVANLLNKGFRILNNSDNWYYVLGDYLYQVWSKGQWGYNDALNGINNTPVTNMKGYNGSEKPIGSILCVWCDAPNQTYEPKKVYDLIKAMAAANPDYFKKEAANVPAVEISENETNVKTTKETVDGKTVYKAAVKADGTSKIQLKVVNIDNTVNWASDKNEIATVDGNGLVTFKGAAGTVTITATPAAATRSINETAAYSITFNVTKEGEVPQEERNITVVVGGTAKDKQDGNVTDISEYNTTIVTISTEVNEVPGSTGEPTKVTNLVSGNKYIISDGKGNYLKRNGTSLTNVSSPDDATEWIVTYGTSASSTAWLISDGGYYLSYYSTGWGLYVRTDTSKYVSWAYNNNGFKYYNENYYLKYRNSNWTVTTNNNGNYGAAYEKGEATPGGEQTTITFRGVAEGTTSATIGHVKYKITVTKENVTNAPKLPVQLWITNAPINVTNVTNETNDWNNTNTKAQYVLVEAGKANKEDGELLSALVPPAVKNNAVTGIDDRDAHNTLWKGVVLNSTTTGLQLCWQNDMTMAEGRVDYQYVRYFGGKWAVSADRENWTVVTGEGSTVSSSDCKEQVIAYYMQRTNVTNEILTDVVDWGNTTEKWNTENPKQYAVLDFAVQYPTERVPNTFPVDGKSVYYHCNQTNTNVVHTDSNGNYYRRIGLIKGINTENYEVYMITVTPTSDTPTDQLTNANTGLTTNVDLKYNGTEKVVWVDDEANLPAEFASADAKYKSISGKFEYNVGGEPNVPGLEIYQRQGMLVTYYLRAKVVQDSLNVYYVDRTANDHVFYNYTISVASGTVFKEGIGLNDPWKGKLKDGDVANIVGVTEWATADLSAIPQIGAQYRYSNYECKEVIRSKDGKDVYLYYIFNSDVTFVVDFGLPLIITPDKVSTNLIDAPISNVIVNKTSQYADVAVNSDKSITYTLNRMISGKDNIGITYSGTNSTTHENGEVSYTVTIIPATSVYYEDSFAKFYGSDGIQQTQFTATGTGDTPGVWYIAGQEKTPTQALEVLGEKTNHNVYGYDPAYNNCTMFSMGSARKVTVTSTMATTGVVWPTAQFTFKGTGFDIISLTDNTSGAIFVDVTRKVNGEEVKERSVFVDNYYGYSYENGTWKAEPNNPNAIYQVPVIKVSGLDYDEYKVVIKVAYNTFFDDANAGSYSFWLDAVRVYDPAGNTLDNDYVKDREVKPIYVEVRKALIGQGGFTADGSGLTNGAVFIDGKSTGASIADYKNFGPNHEVYLAGNQAIAFRIVADRKPDTVQIGVKLANGSNGTLKIGGGNEVKFAAYSNVNASDTLTLSTATDMYYALDGITWTEKNGSQESNVIVLTNTRSDIVSITNVKCTYASITENTTNAVTLAISYDDALMAVDAVNNAITPVEPEPEPEPEPEKTFEPDRFEASWSRNVMQGRKATLTVKTSEDVEAITVDGQTIRSYRTRTERVGFGRRAKRITYREFTYSMVAQETADFSVTAINAEGTESEAITARLTVKTRPNSLRDMWDWFKGWF